MSYGGEYRQHDIEELCQAIARRVAGGEKPGTLSVGDPRDAQRVIKRTVEILTEWGIGRPGGDYERVYGPNERIEGYDMGSGESYTTFTFHKYTQTITEQTLRDLKKKMEESFFRGVWPDRR